LINGHFVEVRLREDVFMLRLRRLEIELLDVRFDQRQEEKPNETVSSPAFVSSSPRR